MNQRWYDQEPSCSRLIQEIREISQPEIREFCGRVLINFGDKVRKEINERDKRHLAVNSIGQQGLSALYRYGEERERWYDQDSVLHKAIGIFYTLSPEGLGIVGFKLGDSFGLLRVYATVCQQLGQPPGLKEMASIATTALNVGTQEAEEVLVELVGLDLYQSITRLKKPPSSPKSQKEPRQR